MSTESLVQVTNPTKVSEETYFDAPAGVEFYDGTCIDVNSGGVVVVSGDDEEINFFSLARPDKITGGIEAANSGKIISQRVGRIGLWLNLMKGRGFGLVAAWFGQFGRNLVTCRRQY